MRTLRSLLIADAAILFALGALFILVPYRVVTAFHLQNPNESLTYLFGLWGCALATLAIGYAIAATDPLRHVAWVQIGIARGALECAFSVVCLVRGIVTFQQAGIGIVIAGLLATAYIILYPRGKP